MGTKLTQMTINELIEAEKAASLICKKYENAIKMYDGSINVSTIEYKEFDKFNNIRISLLKEIEERLKQIE